MATPISRRQFTAATLAAGLTAARAGAQVAQPPREVPWLAQVQTPPPVLPPDAPNLQSLLLTGRGDPIRTLDAWRARREEYRNGWLEFLGTWDPPRWRPEFQIVEADRTAHVSRQLIRYESERNVPVEAYLIRPIKVNRPLPGVVVLHSTVDYTIRQGAGLEGDPAAHWGLKLAERGFVAICPRCFLWEDGAPPNLQGAVARHQRRHPNTRGMAKMLYDARRALDVLTTLPEVDPNRLAAAGHSLGAKESLYLAAFDDRVKATVSSEGGIGTAFSNWDAPWYLGEKVMGHDHHEILGLVAPRAFLLIGGDSADGARSWPYIARALEVYRMYPQTPHIGLFNHGAGHRIPPAAEGRCYEWLQAYV